LTSSRIAFLRPVANRVASKLATAPPPNRPRNSAASSTVTGPRSLPPDADSPLAAAGRGRSFTNVSVSALTPDSRSSMTNCAMSTMCAPMSPSAPDPAFSACSRHTSGNSGSTIQSWRYWARTWRTCPIRPSATSRRASDTAGTRR
jgi:hypothetical protein